MSNQASFANVVSKSLFHHLINKTFDDSRRIIPPNWENKDNFVGGS